MNDPTDIGFEHALHLALENIQVMSDEVLGIDRAVGRVASRPLHGRVDSPSVDASLKDGYAVVSSDIADASEDSPVRLTVTGEIAAGDVCGSPVSPGSAVRIMSGAPVPDGADAVLAEEFTRREPGHILALATAEPRRNILPRGTDVREGELLIGKGDVVRPPLVGLLTAGGLSGIPVYRRPRIGLLATGSEILLPGAEFQPGKLYASNIALQHAWLNAAGVEVSLDASGDSENEIAEAIASLMAGADVVITSGGAWKSDRDLVVKVLETMGWKLIFHRVRMGPGKAVGMGILEGKPVFCLPGGPASNETAFAMIVFPAILKMAGSRCAPYLYLHGRLSRAISGQVDWTQFFQCDVERTESGIILHPNKIKSRLSAMAKTPAVVKIPEGVETIPEGTMVPFFCMDQDLFAWPIRCNGFNY